MKMLIKGRWQMLARYSFLSLVSVILLAGFTRCSNGGGETSDTTTGQPPAAVRPAFTFPLKVDTSAKYLVDQNNKPFLLVGDAAWSLFVGISKSDADLYLENRKQRGFTAVLVNLIEHKFSANHPANFYNADPFTGQTFRTPNEVYFRHVDYVIRSAAAKGIVVFLAPLYLGFNCGDQGWCGDVQIATNADLRAWGEYVGNRYKDFDNIVWVIGGDTDPTPVSTKVQEMVNGIVATDSRHVFTAHNAPDQMAVDPWSGTTWLTLNNIYTDSLILYQSVLSAYAITPSKPVFLIESSYENEHGITPQQLRAQSYWTVLSGGFGHIFGNCPIWGFGFTSGFCASSNWKAQLNSAGAINMQHFQALFNSRHWQTLTPDTTQTVLTAGFGTFGQADYAMAACAADGSSLIAYLPSGRRVSVNGLCLSGPMMNAWWYNPRNGLATSAGAYSTSAAQFFAPPSSEDWVLVLDSSAYSFGPPGSN